VHQLKNNKPPDVLNLIPTISLFLAHDRRSSDDPSGLILGATPAIRVAVGPAAPAFISPNVFKILQDTFDLQLIGSDAKADLTKDLKG